MRGWALGALDMRLQPRMALMQKETRLKPHVQKKALQASVVEVYYGQQNGGSGDEGGHDEGGRKVRNPDQGVRLQDAEAHEQGLDQAGGQIYCERRSFETQSEENGASREIAQ